MPPRTALQPHPGDRIAAGVGSAVVVAAVGWMLVFGLAVAPVEQAQRALALINLAPPPPSPPPEREKPIEEKKLSPAKDKPSPRNLKSKPAEIVAPVPVVVPPPKPPPVVVAPIAGPGMAPTSGASDRPGPGYGAGGEGNGTGGGGDGDGGNTPPEPIKDTLKRSEFPPGSFRPGATTSVKVKFFVDEKGRVTGCQLLRSSGVASVDANVCGLIEQHFRYKPGHDADGRPFRSILDTTQIWYPPTWDDKEDGDQDRGPD